ncbi:FecCD family ABC transporter permease [Arcanobacterium bovis]|uniref:Iron ABC transporter permease n=1 Tax=Arcanobacterium bovis TaxID=2529275 RepID=A0A4Q9UYR7_9ACTO|nr:iron ABC transporter permease [Arcanobacterium bovis]TBW20850.1 iron ABC transporter permease [Arcanobacterium bovis]
MTINNASTTERRHAVNAWRRRRQRRIIIIAVLATIALISFFISLMVGPLNLSVSEVFNALIDPNAPSEHRTVVVNLRLPSALLAFLVGATLSIAGLEMQTILDNPLAEPFTLGVSAAAAFGAALAIVGNLSFAGQWTITISAGLMALLAASIIAAVSASRGGSAETMVLLGIALVFGFQALLALMQYRASTESLTQIVFWTLGSLTRATWTAVVVMAVLLAIALPIFHVLGWSLTALRLGESQAQAFGIRVGNLRIGVLMVCSILAAAAVSFVGIIGFIGLVGPHVARILVGDDQRFVLPASVLSGAALLSSAHALSQILVPGVSLPVGIVTALVGVPVFLMIILGKKRTSFGGIR